MDPVLLKASGNIFFDFIKLRIQPYVAFILLVQCQKHYFFNLPGKHNPRSLLPRWCLPLHRKKVVLLPPSQPQCFCPGSLLLYSPDQSDLILSYASELSNDKEFSVAVPVISLKYQLKINMS